MQSKILCSLLALSTLALSSSALAGPPGSLPVGTQPKCYSLLPFMNASRGDIVLTTSAGGAIKALINALGQKYTHTGLMLGAQYVRHNSMKIGGVSTQENDGLGVVPSNLDGTDLRDGSPGLQTDDLTKGFMSGLILTGPASSATKRAKAATEIERMHGHYRLYAYTNMTWKDPTRRVADDGNMCSGTVAYANIQAGNMPNAGLRRRSYSAAVRDGVAQVVYTNLKASILAKVEKADWSWLLTDARKRGIAAAMANQVVNCMAFNDCGNESNRWRDGVGSGSTLAPDDLKDYVMAGYKTAAAMTGTENTFAYQSTKPIETHGSTYCCRYPVTHKLVCN